MLYIHINPKQINESRRTRYIRDYVHSLQAAVTYIYIPPQTHKTPTKLILYPNLIQYASAGIMMSTQIFTVKKPDDSYTSL